MIIGIDFDDTINNMIETWVVWLNRMRGTSIQMSDITEWEFREKFPGLTVDEFFAPVDIPEFWDDVALKPHAAEILSKLIQDGHKVYIITSSHYKTLPYKFKRCLFAHLPFLTKENVIITYNKSLINCDLLLDDAEHNLINFKGIKVIFDAPYNRNSKVEDFRVTSWEDFYELVNELKNAGIGEK